MKLVPLRCLALVACAAFAAATPARAQFEGPALDSGPWVFESFEQDYLKVSVVARGLDHPFGIALLPGTATATNPLGDALIAERTGKVRVLRNGTLQGEPLIDLTKVFSMEQLFDLKLHPDFASNGWIYFSFIKTAPRPDGEKGYWVTTSLARLRYAEGKASDIQEIYEAKAWSGNIGGASSRLHFLADGTLLFGVSHRIDEQAPQRLDSDIGKILRLNADGSVPKDNPFIGVEGALPEIYSWGIRSVMDFTTHPLTGETWEIENGPQGGDEVNILRPGANYGWPVATYGRDYDGTHFSPLPYVEGTVLPELFWVPSITVSSLRFYTGDVFAKWKHNLFVTGMIRGRIPGTGHLERVKFNERNEEIAREELLVPLKQRLRYVFEGPDQLLYVLTDHSDGALLRIEPATLAEFNAFAAQSGQLTADAPPPDPVNDDPLFANHDCKACHRTDVALVGPSYASIADRYPLADANVALLTRKIIEGGEGVWGETPMSAHPDIDNDTAAAMVRRILTTVVP